MQFNQKRFEAAYQIVQVCDPAYNQQAPLQISVFDQVASTNQTAWELVEQGAPVGTVVLALTQTAGRGQWSRQWLSPFGGLYLSVILTPELAIDQAAQLTLCTAFGITTALRTIPGKLSGVETELPVMLKWPNDLVVENRKLGGILTETRVQQGRIHRVIVGVGINWQNSVPETGINLQSILQTQPIPLIESLEMLAAITIHGLLSGYYYWQQAGIETILPAYVELLSHRDRLLSVEGHFGRIVGVTAQGELRVRLATDDFVDGRSGDNSSEVLLKPGTINLGYSP